MISKGEAAEGRQELQPHGFPDVCRKLTVTWTWRPGSAVDLKDNAVTANTRQPPSLSVAYQPA